MVKRAIVLAQRLVLEGGSQVSPASLRLLRRTLQSLSLVGIEEVCVVDGQHADLLREKLPRHEFPELDFTFLANRSWRKASGSTLRVAGDFLLASEQPCLVLRGDRPLTSATLEELARTELGEQAAVVVVASPPDMDLSDEVKVRLGERRSPGLAVGDSVNSVDIVDIGLDLDHFDAVFTGHALVTPAFLAVLDEFCNPALEDCLYELALAGRARSLPEPISWPWGIRHRATVDEQVTALLESKSHPRYTLLNPGPVNTTARVKSAMVHHDVCHRDASFSELMVSLTGKLRRIFRATPQHTTVMITGSGTAAMECAIASTVPRDGKILVIANGAFGERLCEIATVHDMDAVVLRHEWGELVDPGDVERALEEHPDIAVVAMIHHETSVGLLNPVTEVGALCRRFDALLVVDCVSSLGAEDIDVVRDNIDVCFASANKSLHAVSGAGFLCVAPRVWDKIADIPPRSYYLDLQRYRRYIEELAQTPFTPAVSTYFALDAACGEFLADGHAARFAMYRRRNHLLRQGLLALGMTPFTSTGRESSSVVTCSVPEGVTFEALYDGLRDHGYIVYGCKEAMAGKYVQVANMGDLDEQQIHAFLDTLHRVIFKLRYRSQATPRPAEHIGLRSSRSQIAAR